MSVIDDFDITYCAVCEYAYGSPECYECPLYEGDVSTEDEIEYKPSCEESLLPTIVRDVGVEADAS